MSENPPGSVDHYGASYGTFASEVAAQVRREAFGEDMGQNGWQTVEEQDRFLTWLKLAPASHLLDFACGAGGPALRIAEMTGCSVTGLDIDARAIATAEAAAAQRGLGSRARFGVADGAKPLPAEDGTFDAIICIDAINHLLDRSTLFAEWQRVLRPGGVALFTNPVTITGPITGTDLAIRASIGVFLFTPVGADEHMLEQAGFRVIEREDRTDNMARSARGRLDARARHAAELKRIEGEQAFEGQQVFFETAARLAEQRRLSRIALLARRL